MAAAFIGLNAVPDWPQLTFGIYHSAIRSVSPPGKEEVAQFEKGGYIPWGSELPRVTSDQRLHLEVVILL